MQQATAGGPGTGVFLPSHGAVGDPLPGGALYPSPGMMPGLPPTGPQHAALCGASQRSDETHSARTESPPSGGDQAAQQQQSSVRALLTHTPARSVTLRHGCVGAEPVHEPALTVYQPSVRKSLLEKPM